MFGIVASLEDINSDLVRDFAVGAFEAGIDNFGDGIVYVYSGADCNTLTSLCEPLYTLVGHGSSEGSGRPIAGLGR